MRLFHFSEDPEIRVFVPRAPQERPEVEPLVWAIDEAHAPMYYFPRQCPRACFWPGNGTSDADRKRFFHGVSASMIIAVEWRWLERIRATRLYRYELPLEPFMHNGTGLNDTDAGHWTTRESVVPLRVEPLGDLIEALATADVELRLTPRLDALWQQVIASTLQFSGTRLRNAQGFPLPEVATP